MTDIPIKFRIPTGAVRTEGDWPGLFIRGDDCMRVQAALISIFGGDRTNPYVLYLKELLETINTEILPGEPKEDGPS